MAKQKREITINITPLLIIYDEIEFRTLPESELIDSIKSKCKIKYVIILSIYVIL